MYFKWPFYGLSSELNLQDLAHLLDKVFLIFPNYCLGMSFSQFYQNYELLSFCTSNFANRFICHKFSKCSNWSSSLGRTIPLRR